MGALARNLGGNARPRAGDVQGLLLAAGSSSRFGGAKLIEAKVKGRSIGLLAAETFRNVVPVNIVVRAEDNASRAMFESAGFQVIVAEQAALGMGYSLAAGIEFIKAMEVDGCLVGLADMPFIQEHTIEQLRDRLISGAEIVRPRYCGRPGQPVGFRKQHFKSLCGISKDSGAREFLRDHQALVEYLDVEDEGTIIDIDTKDELSNLEKERAES